MADEIKRFVTNDGEYDRTKLIDTIFKNAENYGTYRKNRQRNFDVGAFNAALSDVTEAIENGTLTRGAGRKYNYTGNNQLNTAAHAAVLDLVDRTLSVMSRLPKEEAEKYQSNVFDRFNKRFYGGNFTGTEDDLLPWKQGVYTYDALASIFDDEANDLQSAKDKGLTYDFEGSPYYDYDDGISKNRKLAQNLRDGTIDTSDLADWIATGGDATTFRQLTGLTPPRENAIEKEWKDKEQVLRDLELPEEEIQKRRAQFYELKRFDALKPFYSQDYNEKWNAFAKQHFTGKGESDLADLGVDEIDLTDWNGEKTNEANNKPSWLEREGNADYADRLYKHALSGTYYEGAKDGYTNSQILRLYMAEQLAKDPDQFLKIDDNNVLISSTIDLNTGTAVKFNTDTNKFTKVYVDPQSTPILLAELKKKYQEINPYLVHSGDYVWGSFAKKGGKLNQLKALKRGGNIQYALSGAELAKLKKEEREGKYEQSVIDRALQKGVSEDAIRLGDKAANTDDSTNSLIRNISTGLDVAGGVASFIPVIGNAAGAILGTVGTVGNLVADAMDDSVSSEEMWTNLGINAGLTGLMLIPGGGTASLAGKAIKGAKTVAQVGMTGYAGYNVAKNWDRIKELRKKADEGTLSHEERRELNMYYSMASGTVTGTKGIAAHAAPKLGKNWAGKTAATIADPIVALGNLTGNKKSSRVFNDMLKSTKPVRTTAEGRAKGELFEYTDANGKTWEITAAQKKAMLQAESDGRAAGLTGKELDQKIGEAWANAHPEKATKNITYSTPEENFTKTWETADDAIKAALGATKDPITGDITIGNITFSNKSATTLKDVYNDAISRVPDTDPRLAGKTGADLDMAKHQIGIEAARVKFADLPEAKGVKAGTINGPVFDMSNTFTMKKWFNKAGIHKSSLDLEDTGSSTFSRWANSGEGYRFDQNTATGRGNLRMRMRQRQHAQDYFSGLGKFGDALLDKFNTNWEMGQGMSAFRNRTDKLLDANAKRRAFQSSKEGKDTIALQEFRKTGPGKLVLQDLENRLGRTPTRQEQIDAMKVANKNLEPWRIRADKATTRAENLKEFKNTAYGRQVLKDLEVRLGREATSQEQILEMRMTQKHRNAFDRRHSDLEYEGRAYDDIQIARNKVPGWKSKSMSDDKILEIYQNARANGYDGDITGYAKYLDRQRTNLKKTLGKKPTAKEVWDYERNLAVHNKLGADFQNSKRAVEIARTRYGLTDPDDAKILQRLNDPSNKSMKENIISQIDSEMRVSMEVANFRRGLAKGPDYNPENKALIDNYRRNNPKASVGKTDTELIESALSVKRTNERVVNDFIARSNGPDGKSTLSESQLSNIKDTITSGKIVKESDLINITKKIRNFEEASAKQVARNQEIQDLFDNDPKFSLKVKQAISKALRAEPDKSKHAAIKDKIRNQVYDEYIANKKSVEEARARADAKLARQQELSERKARIDAENEAAQRRFAEESKAADEMVKSISEDYELSPSEIVRLKSAARPYNIKERKQKILIENARRKKSGLLPMTTEEEVLFLDKLHKKEYDKVYNTVISGKSNAETRAKTKADAELEAQKKADEKYQKQLDNYRNAAQKKLWENLESEYKGTKSKDFDKNYTSAIQHVINNNKHLSDAGVTVNNIKSFIRHYSATQTFNQIINRLKDPRILSELAKPEFLRHGSKINVLKNLRSSNFIIDNFNSSQKLSYKDGGILKGENGLVVPEWYKKLYKQHQLEGWNSSLNSDYAGKLHNSNWHNQSGSIDNAYKYNDAYIGSGNIAKDIQSYFDTTNHNTIDEFVDDYNKKIKLIDDRWQSNKRYNDTGAREGNQAFKQLFSSSLNKDNIYHLGYDDNVDDIYGSTSWLRRADRYEKELSDLTEDELKSRTHVIKDKGGKEWVVYKNADGTITHINPTSNTDSSSNGNGVLQGDGGGTDDPQKQSVNWEQIESVLNKNIPEGLSALRLFKNLRNNKRISELAKLKRAVYKSPIQGHENVYGDFQALQSAQNASNNLMSTAYRAASMYNSPEYAGAMLLDAQLKANDAERLGRQTDNAAIKESAYRSEVAEKERYAKNHEIGYENSVKSNAKHSADIDATIGEHSANTTNWNTWLSEQEQRFRQKNLDNEELYRKIALSDFEKWWSDNVTDTPEIKVKLQQLQETTDDATYNKLLNEIYKMRADNADRYSDTKFQKLRDIMKGDYWSKLNTNYSGQFQIQLKKGGKVNDAKIKRRAEDLRELRKQIRHSITTNQKALNNLSRATLLELKKMMDL